MTVRPPQHYNDNSAGKNPFNVLEYELMSERADSLSRAGLRAEEALERLSRAEPDNREALLDAAADHVYALFIQREICGLRNGREVIARYGIPGAVLARLGVVRKPPAASQNDSQ